MTLAVRRHRGERRRRNLSLQPISKGSGGRRRSQRLVRRDRPRERRIDLYVHPHLGRQRHGRSEYDGDRRRRRYRRGNRRGRLAAPTTQEGRDQQARKNLALRDHPGSDQHIPHRVGGAFARIPKTPRPYCRLGSLVVLSAVAPYTIAAPLETLISIESLLVNGMPRKEAASTC